MRQSIHGYTHNELLTTGRPCVDDLFHDPDETPSQTLLRKLGLDERPIVWWLPTWLQDNRGAPTPFPVATTSPLSIDEGQLSQFQFVVKPHRLSPPSQWPQGWTELSDSDLANAGARLYRLLGKAHAIITDYSSVWLDLLGTRVPLAFYLVHLNEFQRNRGFYEENWQDYLPGPLIRTKEGLAEFVLEAFTRDQAKRRQEVIDELGVVNWPGATQRLFEALDLRGIKWR